MGNCLILQEKKVIEIMRMDGEVLRYPSPLKVQQVLNEFPGHAISDALPVIACLDPEKRMRHGQLYYLLPPKKPVAETSAGEGLVRIKLVVSKQELKEMVRKGGVSLDDMITKEQQILYVLFVVVVDAEKESWLEFSFFPVNCGYCYPSERLNTDKCSVEGILNLHKSFG
ncbi:unnamed protein product [Musa acuminata subsp. burmannicoides]